METILDKILEEKRCEVAAQKKRVTLSQLKDSFFYSRRRLSMSRALAQATPAGIIAEFKRKSPSKGFIKENASAGEIVAGYARAGAAACSVLTDRTFFAGAAEDLIAARKAVRIPLLRKDFVVDEYQLHQAAAWGADAVLLIAAALEKGQCQELACRAHELGLEVLLEVHGEDELEYVNPEVNMVGVNNRNLKTFHTDVAVSLQLAGMMPAGVVRVSESGIDDPAVVSRLKQAGFDGFLIGERFMREPDPGAALKDFLCHVD